jgi:hypothetical protein
VDTIASARSADAALTFLVIVVGIFGVPVIGFWLQRS